MHSKLYVLTFKVRKPITRAFDNKYKYIAKLFVKLFLYINKMSS